MRRWKAGQSFTINGVVFRIVEGVKEPPGDLRLEVLADEGWVPASMTLGFFLADFFYENENHLFPPSNGFEGGEMYIDACRDAGQSGWRKAAEVLQEQKRQSRLFPLTDD